MRIVIVSSEAVPFAKTGGLADVATALSKALSRDGHEVSLIIPYYPQSIAAAGLDLPLEQTECNVEAKLAQKYVCGRVLRTGLPGTHVDVFLVDQPGYYHRNGLYTNGDGHDFSDNCERFLFFSRAALEVVREFKLRPDIVHANDWQTGIIPAVLDIDYQDVPGFERTASVFTIHNMAFQGRFWRWDMPLTGLDWKYFNAEQMEFYGDVNLLKTGIVFSDLVTTVSPTYAQEIQTPEFGCGLEGVLHTRAEDLVGILNGIDSEEWNPATDRHLAANYSLSNLEGKAKCKAALQERMGLPVRPDVPLFGMVSRMTGQKGFDLIRDAAETILANDLQICFLGSGEEQYQSFCELLARHHPEKVATKIGFDEGLAHQIEAGCDVYLMPSAYEPCGLNQMYSLSYGTIPIVHRVGGLADTVADASHANLIAGTATGFVFDEYRSDVLAEQISRAIATYQNKDRWKQLMTTAMSQDWSWSRSARDYVANYEKALSNRRTDVAG